MFTGKGLVVFLAIVGGGFTAIEIGKGVQDVEGQHWMMLIIFFVAGAVIARVWPAPLQALGLP